MSGQAAPFHFGFLLYPGLTQLDLTGPAQVFSRAPGAVMHYVWKTRDPVPSDAGITILPTDDFASCPQVDLLCVPGGAGQVALMEDRQTLAWLKSQGDGARYVTSVCTGSLLLGAAGLLNGYRSACHWMWRDALPMFGSIPVNERVVQDRNRISGGGVTAGIDFALTVMAEIWGPQLAHLTQLFLEYNPQPPFDVGSPEKAGPELVALAKKSLAAMASERDAAMRQAAEKISV